MARHCNVLFPGENKQESPKPKPFSSDPGLDGEPKVHAVRAGIVEIEVHQCTRSNGLPLEVSGAALSLVPNWHGLATAGTKPESTGCLSLVIAA
jgi:hypothetical protein